MNTRICKTCGTLVLVDDETQAEVHFDVTYRNCGVEGELSALADYIETGATPVAPSRARHLRSV